jgi:LPS-assembly protein
MKIISSLYLILAFICLMLSATIYAEDIGKTNLYQSLTRSEKAEALGWVQTGENRCGGYYLEHAISTAENRANPHLIHIVSDQFMYSFKGTSESQGKIIIRRYGQEISANKGFLYRDPKTGKLNSGSIDLLGNVQLREPNTFVLAERGQFNFQTKAPSLIDILYRTTIYKTPGTPDIIEQDHKIYELSAWGSADSFDQPKPKVFTMENASYTTCPPAHSLWKMQASHIILNKETGRGEAYHAKILIHNVPIAYTPYINFPIDSRRKTGFLWPLVGVTGKEGPLISTPFYWNMAPNYDMTITPSLLYKRNLKLTGLFRYLTPTSSGFFKATILPYDRTFAEFRTASEENNDYINSTNPFVLAEVNRLSNASTTRRSFIWRDNTRFNDHWFGSIDYNYVGDDYYLRDLVSGINEVTENQLLQKADIAYKDEHWNFTGRVQNYQTLHPINTTPGAIVQNQYSRYPQLILNGNYPEERFGIFYGAENELTHFDISNTPGSSTKNPIGDRINVQPIISRPIILPYFTLSPRLQYAMTKYAIGRIANNQSSTPSRMLPIFDINSTLSFDRSIQFFGHSLTQTLEPQVYYTYIPFRDQNQLPVFDTTLNQLTYDQLFTYNRFSGIDRIGDTNQLAAGVITRFIDQESGFEKMRAGVGQIYYFKNRDVTLCTTPGCSDVPAYPNFNKRNRSPITGILTYHLNPVWSLEGNTIWDPLAKTQKLTNQTATLHYQPDARRIINLGYTFVLGGDQQFPTPNNNNASNNLSQTDLSVAWPLTRDWSGVARWTENLNRHNFQNLLFGLQYDSCCWAVRVVAGKEFVGVQPNNTLQYNPLIFVQFALKGLGNFGTGDPTQLLMSSVSGYHNQFGQDF